MLTKSALKGLMYSFLAALALGFSMIGVAQAGDQRLPGMWEIVGTPDASSGVPPFFNISQISQDGTMSNIDPNEGVGLGSWRRVSNNQYEVTFYGFIPLGQEIGRYAVTGLLSVGADHNTFYGDFITQITSLDGTDLFAFTGTINATRL